MDIQLANRTIVSLVSMFCLLGLVVTLNNVLRVPVQAWSRDLGLLIMFYAVFGFLCPEPRGDWAPSVLRTPWLWSLLIFLVTLAILFSYAR